MDTKKSAATPKMVATPIQSTGPEDFLSRLERAEQRDSERSTASKASQRVQIEAEKKRKELAQSKLAAMKRRQEHLQVKSKKREERNLQKRNRMEELRAKRMKDLHELQNAAYKNTLARSTPSRSISTRSTPVRAMHPSSLAKRASTPKSAKPTGARAVPVS
jgi:hypothetical protein